MTTTAENWPSPSLSPAPAEAPPGPRAAAGVHLAHRQRRFDAHRIGGHGDGFVEVHGDRVGAGGGNALEYRGQQVDLFLERVADRLAAQADQQCDGHRQRPHGERRPV